jgi:hypothetical protein
MAFCIFPSSASVLNIYLIYYEGGQCYTWPVVRILARWSFYIKLAKWMSLAFDVLLKKVR